MPHYILYESASGFALFNKTGGEEIAELDMEVQYQYQNFKQFSKIMHLTAFLPFTSSENALENANDLSEGILNNYLKNFLETNIPKGKNVTLGVCEEKIGSSIHSALQIKCEKSKTVLEMIRCIRYHFPVYLKQLFDDKLKKSDIITAQRGLSHAYSRAKVKFNVNKQDNMITQAISLLDQLQKDVNTFSMRIREWYSYHFPELIKIIPDNIQYIRCVLVVNNRREFTEEKFPDLMEILEDEDKVQEVYAASRSSMGTDMSEIDILTFHRFAKKVVSLAQYEASLLDYLKSRMNEVAPNISALIGEVVGARLISRAGSLISLAKYPASTIQILGAEKALFRALKVRGRTPKFGLLYNTSFISKARMKDKGRISRCIANQCAKAASIDAFSDNPTSYYGEMFKEQIEERLRFYETGKPPRKNVDAMKEVREKIEKETDVEEEEETMKESDKMDVESEEETMSKSEKKEKKEKKKKDKKKKEKKKKKSKEKS